MLSPGADIDARGVTFTEPLLHELLAILRDPDTGHPNFGNADFGGAAFSGDAQFGEAAFSGNAQFIAATFSGYANFSRAVFSEYAGFAWVTFSGAAEFGKAAFSEYANFSGAVFSEHADFYEAVFTGDAEFAGVTISRNTLFEKATFSGDAGFGEVTFSGDTSFSRATFSGDAEFGKAAFAADAEFRDATFSGYAGFARATFSGRAKFAGATFRGDIEFAGATFSGHAEFGETVFSGHAEFNGVTFSGHAEFSGAAFSGAGFDEVRFGSARVVGPLVASGSVTAVGAVFAVPVTVEIRARAVSLTRVRFEGPATVRVYGAEVDLSEVQATDPLTVASTRDPLPRDAMARNATEALMMWGPGSAASVTSLRRVDAALLVLRDIDLSRCRFADTQHLDQLGLEGECTFAAPPPGIRWRRGIVPVWWTRRQVLAEEQHWRAREIHPPALRAGWQNADPAQPSPHPGPAALAVEYRKLRKAFEDGKDEPGAAHFYYGEMEMRRHDQRRTPRAERALLHAYWLLSGYGLRATRAFAWLAAAMTVTLAALVLFGLPNADPQPHTTGIQAPPGQRIDLTVDSPDPTLTGSLDSRVTGPRVEKALRVVLNSVIFRSSDQTLTTSGTYTEMASRLTEPVLLGLGLLAIRSRVKR